MDFFKFTLFVFGVLLLGGCTYNVHPLPMKEGMVKNFESQFPINIINTQDAGVIKIDGGMGDKVNLHKTTDAAIALFREELGKRGVEFKEDSGRSLSVSIDDIHVRLGFWMSRCIAFLSVETGDGFKGSFSHYDLSGIAPNIACNFAVTKVVAAALNDQNIHNYITDGSSSDTSNQEKLIELKRLLDIGLLTNDEYDKKRKNIIDNL